MTTYQQKLSPWTITRVQPNHELTTIARFRRRSEAEGHLRIVQQFMPEAKFAIVFDVGHQAAS